MISACFWAEAVPPTPYCNFLFSYLIRTHDPLDNFDLVIVFSLNIMKTNFIYLYLEDIQPWEQLQLQPSSLPFHKLDSNHVSLNLLSDKLLIYDKVYKTLSHLSLYIYLLNLIKRLLSHFNHNNNEYLTRNGQGFDFQSPIHSTDHDIPNYLTIFFSPRN